MNEFGDKTKNNKSLAH